MTTKLLDLRLLREILNLFKAVMLNIHALNPSYTRFFSINVDFVVVLFVIHLGVFNYYQLIKIQNPSKSNLVTYKNTFSMRVEINECITVKIEMGCGWREKCIKNGRQNTLSNKSVVCNLQKPKRF